MPNINVYGDLSPRIGGRNAAEFLKELRPALVLQKFGKRESQGKNKGRSIFWRRIHNLPPALAPLVEGVTPSGQRISYSDVPSYLQQYGDVVYITDVIADTHEDPILAEIRSNAAGAAAQTVELLTYSTLCSGTQVLYAGGASATARTEVSSGPTKGDIRRAVRTLQRNLTPKITKVISASPNVGTRPVEAGYYAVCHEDLENDLRNIPGFLLAVEYGNARNVLPEEFGSLEKVRFVTSQNAKPWLAAATNKAGTTYLSNGQTPTSSAAPDVYPILIFGEGAFGVIGLQGPSAATISVVNPTATISDPLAQRGAVGWKLWFDCVILDDLRLLRYEVLCKADPSGS